jgi:hypothetical protein
VSFFPNALAETSIEGFAPSVGSMVQYTRSQLAGLARALERRVKFDQSAAFQVGGHQLHGGNSWAPLSPTTVAIKTALGSPRPSAPLYRTGYMSGRTKVKVYLQLYPKGIAFSVFVWNDAFYAKFHQDGYQHVWSGRMVPARPVVELTPADLEYIGLNIQSYMLDGVKGMTTPMTQQSRAVAKAFAAKEKARAKAAAKGDKAHKAWAIKDNKAIEKRLKNSWLQGGVARLWKLFGPGK